MRKNQTINILCATDDNYVPYCGIMLTSVFENNTESSICAYILIDKPLSAHNNKKFNQLAKKYKQQIECILVDKSYLEHFPIKGMDYWSIATYYRLYAAELLPKTIDRVLYLDCDIIVTSSLASLWDIEMKDIAICAVPDIFIYSDEYQNRLHYPTSNGYFNAGVVLMNLDYWRTHSIGQKCLDFLGEHYDWIVANDQDVLNAILHDKKIDLPLKYNFQLQFLSNHFFNLQTKEMQEQIMKTINNPIIMHYAYSIKPWSVMYYKMPFSNLWKEYKHKSLWKYMLPTFPKGRKSMNWIIKRFILWSLGIMKYKSGFIEFEKL